MFNHVLKVDPTTKLQSMPDGGTGLCRILADGRYEMARAPFPGGVLYPVEIIGLVYDVLTEEPYTGDDLVYSAEWTEGQPLAILKDWPEDLAALYKEFDKLGIQRRPHVWAGWPLPTYPEEAA